MSDLLSIPLQKVRCMGCAKKISAALNNVDGVITVEVDTHAAKLSGDFILSDAFNAIEQLDYLAGEHHQLALSGLNCGRCVAKVESALAPHPLIAHYSVSKTELHVTGLITEADLIALIHQIGFQANQQKSSFPLAEPSVTEALPTPTEPVQANQSNSQDFMLTGMTCASCVASVEQTILSVTGVTSAVVNLAEKTASVRGSASSEQIIAAIISAGYGAQISDDESERRATQKKQQQQLLKTHRTNTIISLSIGIPLMLWGLLGGNMMISSPQDQLIWGVVGILCLGLLFTAGRHFFINAWKAFTHHRATMDTLVALGTGAAWLYSMTVVIAPYLFPAEARHIYFEATAMILGLITLGHAIETNARGRTSQALEKLLNLQPQTATLIENGIEREVPLNQVIAGMLLRLKPGNKVPVDGRVIEGNSYVDESMLTGEPIPTLKTADSTIKAGTLNQQGSLTFIAEQIGEATTLSRIIAMVRQAQSSKPALAKLADQISAIFVPSVMIIATLAAMAWYNFGPQPSSVYMLVVATTVLIIACPCALGLATPMSVTVGVGRAAEFGVLIKDADVLQQASTIDTVVVDKTGTLTQGKPVVVDMLIYQEWQKSELLPLSSAVESHSEHPLAQAIVNYAKPESALIPTCSDFLAVLGLGAQATVDQQQVVIGNQKFMQQHGIETSAADSDLNHASHQANTPILMAVNGELAALFLVTDPLRDDSALAISQLKQQGIDVVMLTGDTQTTATIIAEQLGIQQVIASVLPDGKSEQIVKLQAQGKRVAMIGDGINDAPALAQANVGIAMGSGSDIAIESAQITLMRHSLVSAVQAIELSKATLDNMKQNLFGAFIYNILGIPIAAGILYPLTGSLLSPVIAGAAMALSSITVVSNANRLRLFTPSFTNKNEVNHV
ncbi:copper-translocating P-type ATPase [Aliivibrio kagoshimensis]|uniref:cation transporter n=1 Tax=Aliivibrio kagoshimensis TaxID=2910230 RepID=UPI003D13B444